MKSVTCGPNISTMPGSRLFNLDSYAGRGLNTMQEAGSMAPITRVIDAYAALAVLAKHPLVDPGKIVVMGFSHGSQAAMYSNLERFQKLYAGGLKFAAHISFYGICGTTFKDDEATLSPMLLVHGQADDWVPMQPCREYAGRLEKANQKITLKIYQNAHHAFDAKVLGKVVGMKVLCRSSHADGQKKIRAWW